MGFVWIRSYLTQNCRYDFRIIRVMFFKNMDAGSGHQYDHCFSRVTVFSLGGVLPIMAYMGRLRPRKGYLFQASGTCICKDFTSYSVRKCVISVCNEA